LGSIPTIISSITCFSRAVELRSSVKEHGARLIQTWEDWDEVLSEIP
jgi:hypothetical protein